MHGNIRFLAKIIRLVFNVINVIGDNGLFIFYYFSNYGSEMTRQ